ncbi:MAG: DUF1850 domain-containing protein [Bacillota bacterium]
MRVRRWCLGLLAGATVLYLALSPRIMVLEIDCEGNLAARARASAGGTFQVSFLHSVEGIEVAGTFRIETDGSIRPLETSYPSFGAGLEAISPWENHSITEGTMILRVEAEAMEEILFRSQHFTKHRFTMGSMSVPLGPQEGTLALVSVRTRRIPWHEFLLDRPRQG